MFVYTVQTRKKDIMKNRRKSDTHAVAVPQTASVSKEEVSTAVTRNPSREEQFATKADLKRTEKYLVKMVKQAILILSQRMDRMEVGFNQRMDDKEALDAEKAVAKETLDAERAVGKETLDAERAVAKETLDAERVANIHRRLDDIIVLIEEKSEKMLFKEAFIFAILVATLLALYEILKAILL